MSEIRFYADEHVATAIVTALRLGGADILTAAEAGLLGADDNEHLQFALSQRRVIFTQDADFLRLSAVGQSHAGIVYAHQLSKIGPLVRGLMLIHSVLAAEDMFGAVEYL